MDRYTDKQEVNIGLVQLTKMYPTIWHAKTKSNHAKISSFYDEQLLRNYDENFLYAIRTDAKINRMMTSRIRTKMNLTILHSKTRHVFNFKPLQ
jgi:hypothetical protein